MDSLSVPRLAAYLLIFFGEFKCFAYCVASYIFVHGDVVLHI